MARIRTETRISRNEAAKYLARVPEDKVFRCNDGAVMGDMKELAQALETMSEESYFFHANENRNDFSNWVADVMGDRELAEHLRMATNNNEAARIVSDRVALLNKAMRGMR